jgi:hypothetical protein
MSAMLLLGGFFVVAVAIGVVVHTVHSHRLMSSPYAPGGLLFASALIACLWPIPVSAAGLNLPPGAEQGLNLLYSGQTEAALADFKQIQADQPASPLGYLLEAELRWWQIYCQACEIKWNMVDAWQRSRLPSDDSYLELLDKSAALAESHIAQNETAEMQFYAGMAYALRARLTGLRIERRVTASAGIRAREHFLRALQLDPQLTDAYAGIGLYNYYVDTLSAAAKVLRFIMHIPGGDKKEGIRQLLIAAQSGTVTRVGARFYLAKNLRTFDLDYARSIEIMTPLVNEFPQNPVFRLILADTHAKLGHKETAESEFRAAAAAQVSDSACRVRVQQIVSQSLGILSASATPQ